MASQFFVGQKSNEWKVYPLRTEANNIDALQDYTRTVGAPDAIRSDNAQSEVADKEWKSHLRSLSVEQQSTVPHSPWMNFAERKIGQLNSMVVQCLREFGAPLTMHDWCQVWCCDVHNIAASRKLGWLCPSTIVNGHTADISPFRFHFWEPVWYYQPGVKSPKSKWLPGRWLGFAHSVGDHFTYYVRTEKPTGEGRQSVIVRNLVISRRKHIGTEREYVTADPEDPELSELTLDPRLQAWMAENTDVTTGEPLDETTTQDELNPATEDEPNDPLAEPELEPLEETDDPETIYDTHEIEALDDFDFEKIVDHKEIDGKLVFQVRYWSGDQEDHMQLEVPFQILKKDHPVEIARYIREYVVDEKRSGFYNTWAQAVLKRHTRATRRLSRLYFVDLSNRIGRTHRRIQRARRQVTDDKSVPLDPTTTKTKPKRQHIMEKFGIPIPRNTREALLFDKQNKNTKWADAIAKEMSGLERLRVFEFHSSSHVFKRADGWQFAPLHMIFDVKHDGRYKARLVCGGNVLDSSRFTTYSSTIQNISVRMLMVVAVQNKLQFLAGDVGNAFPTAPCREKVWTTAGPEFGERQGSKVSLKRALYGLATASRAFHEFFGDTLRAMGFEPTRADQDLWIRRSDDYDGYDYIATHVDDLIIVSKDPSQYMSQLEQQFKIRDISDSPEYYLGNDLRKHETTFHVSTGKYIREALRRYQERYGSVKKEKSPMSPDEHPELDASSFLDPPRHREYQHIIGMCQWMITAGRMDICYAITSLSRYSSAPREGHLLLAQKVLGYLRTYPDRGYYVNPKEPEFVNQAYERVNVPQDFGNQYKYFKEDIDPRAPEPLLDEMSLLVFVDADHAHDKVSGRSITGLITFLGSTPLTYASRRQTTVQTSTFGAEFTALKKAVEEAVTIRYHLRSMGVKVTKPTPIFVDNLSVVLNAQNPGSTLNKKWIALAYHFVREHVANGVVEIRKIDSADNYADPFTKAMNARDHGSFFNEYMCNPGLLFDKDTTTPGGSEATTV